MSTEQEPLDLTGAVDLLREGREGVSKWNDNLLHLLADAREYPAPLSGLVFDGLDLCGVSFGGISLQRASFIRTDLRGSDFRKAEVFKSEFYECKMDKVDFSNASIDYTSFRDSRLANCVFKETLLHVVDFENSDLISTRFQNCTLSGTNFYHAFMSGTIFDSNLSEVRGLDRVFYSGPSFASPLSLETVREKHLKAFLKGCGYPDGVFEYYQSSRGAIRFYSCFISYSHNDKVFAQQLEDYLQGRGIRCWRDEKDMKIGERIRRAVTDAIRLHDHVVLLCSKASLDSRWVHRELAALFEKEEKEGRDALIPLDLDSYLLEWDGEYGPEIRERLAGSFKGWEKNNALMRREFEKVARALQRPKSE
ncbi:MAG: toll/interleukin-1 receptor domain-containing protein [Planctomycetota bacterium]|nr:MAG: toll/interleukin-1 receptor domain-containing protein [Planctomycetota bacterium]